MEGRKRGEGDTLSLVRVGGGSSHSEASVEEEDATLSPLREVAMRRHLKARDILSHLPEGKERDEEMRKRKEEEKEEEKSELVNVDEGRRRWDALLDREGEAMSLISTMVRI